MAQLKAFVAACAAGDVDAAERLLAGDGGIDLCARGLSGATAAHAAAQSGSLPLLELLHRHAAAADVLLSCDPAARCGGQPRPGVAGCVCTVRG